MRRKNIEAYLRAATCLSKLGCLTAADRVLDKVRGGAGELSYAEFVAAVDWSLRYLSGV